MDTKYIIGIIETISSAHKIRDYPGKCENLHGHNWKIEVEVGAEVLNDLGMVIDFGDLKKHLKDILINLDHKVLNEEKIFTSLNPTSENIAKYIYDELLKVIPNKIILRSVRVWENETSYAIYKG